MPQRPWLVESDKPSYQVLKWIGGGGFGQVFKVVRGGQARRSDPERTMQMLIVVGCRLQTGSA